MKQKTAFFEVKLQSGLGDAEARYFPSPEATRGVVFVPGAIGGWHSPAHNLYGRLVEQLNDAGIAALQIKFRDPHALEEATRDVLAGLAFFEDEGIKRAGVVGHSFGGAVVIAAAARSKLVRTVVALSTQSYGAIPAIYALGRRCSILLAHGADDEILPPECSQYVYNETRGRRKLLLLPHTRHGLDEAANQLLDEVRAWLLKELGPVRSS
ncbi:MAG TPA: alpha/beta fold hydrolase [Planctomycetota bacterium]|nr:alpha/beta fold hydrolase [Planctomycetota bacterium]